MLEKSLCAAESSGLLCSAPPAGRSPADCEPTRAGDCGGPRRRLLRNAHAFPPPLRPTRPSESEPRPHSATLDDDRIATQTPAQPGAMASPEVQRVEPSAAQHTMPSSLVPEPASPTTPPPAPPTAAGSTPSPQTSCLTRPRPEEETENATGLPTPVRERFYYYRSPAEPRAGGATEQTWRPGRRQSWHCGQLPPSTDARR